MPDKKSKYDTDPLDPDFARQTGEMWGESETGRVTDPARTGQIGGGETRRYGGGGSETAVPPPQPRPMPDLDAPTRRIDGAIPQSYPSVFVPTPYQPPSYQPPPAPTGYGQPGAQPQQPQQPQQPHGVYAARPFAAERNVAGLGIPERYANVAAYAPFYIGCVVSVIELLVVPRSEARTRFHAAQALGMHLLMLAVSFALGIIGGIGGLRVGGVLFSLASIGFLIFSMVKVWNGKEHRISPLADVTRFLDERIDPRN